jgi:hypothetical protein
MIFRNFVPTSTIAIWLAVTALACGGSFTSSSDGSDSGRGGGGTGGDGGACTEQSCLDDAGETGGNGGGDADAECSPMPGCSSKTSCYDGCNTCSCFHGTWACTARACFSDAATTDAATGTCNDDNGCVFRQESGCCGACLAVTDPVPPQLGCGIACPIAPPSCLCVDHRCSTGTLTAGAPCEPSRDRCSAGLMCCPSCGGPDLPDGANCGAPVCAYPVWSASGAPQCPKSP